MNIPKITILLDPGYHPDKITAELQKLYPQIMTKIRFELAPKPTKAEKAAVGNTNLADHLEPLSHDRVNRYLRREKLTPSLLWDNVKALIQITENAYVIFDDTVLDRGT